MHKYSIGEHVDNFTNLIQTGHYMVIELHAGKIKLSLSSYQEQFQLATILFWQGTSQNFLTRNFEISATHALNQSIDAQNIGIL